MHALKTHPITASRSCGFTLIEVLVAVLVLSIGLLGLAALQTESLRTNHSAHYRSQATFLTYDIIDRMRANRAAALAGNYNLALGATVTGTATAAMDITDWKDRLAEALPEGDGSISVATATGVVDIIVQWNDERAAGEAEQQFSLQTQL